MTKALTYAAAACACLTITVVMVIKGDTLAVAFRGVAGGVWTALFIWKASQ